MSECPPGGDLGKLREHLGWRMGKRVSLPHAVGAVFAAVSGGLAAANIPGKGVGFGPIGIAVFGVYLPVAFVTCGLRTKRSYKRATEWRGENRPPTRLEQPRTLRLHRTVATEGMILRLPGDVSWGTLNLSDYGNRPTFAAPI